jgi:hypothetical protein
MTLIACEDCQREISKRAHSCPLCGCPTQGGRVWNYMIGSAIGVGFVAAVKYVLGG